MLLKTGVFVMTLLTASSTGEITEAGVVQATETKTIRAQKTKKETVHQELPKERELGPDHQTLSVVTSRKRVSPNPCNEDTQLDKWIHEALSVMDKNKIPGSYDGICRNIIRESGGDPEAVNEWDINAQNGTPSMGLLQIIKPTFDTYWNQELGVINDQTDPVANIVVSCAYAADRYGSIDNVSSAY